MEYTLKYHDKLQVAYCHLTAELKTLQTRCDESRNLLDQTTHMLRQMQNSMEKERKAQVVGALGHAPNALGTLDASKAPRLWDPTPLGNRGALVYCASTDTDSEPDSEAGLPFDTAIMQPAPKNACTNKYTEYFCDLFCSRNTKKAQPTAQKTPK